jgi:hypothetical protein
VGIPVPRGNCSKPRDGFSGQLLTRLRAFRHACRGSRVNHSGLSLDGRLHRRSLRRHFQTAAFLLERGIVPAVLERLSDLDRPDDLARWPGPLE